MPDFQRSMDSSDLVNNRAIVTSTMEFDDFLVNDTIENNQISNPFYSTLPGIGIYKDIPYRYDQSQNGFVDFDSWKLDLYTPVCTEDVPLVIFIHGGAFIGGNKENFFSSKSGLIRNILSSGKAVAIVNYRLMKNLKEENIGMSKSFGDVASAIRFLQRYSEDINIQRDNIVLLGASAGSGIAFKIGLDYQNSDTPEHLKVSGIKGIVGLSVQATYNFDSWDSLVFKDEYNKPYRPFTMNNIIENNGAFQKFFSIIYGLGDVVINNENNFDSNLFLDAFRMETNYKTEYDLLQFLDADDPLLYIRNNGKIKDPRYIWDPEVYFNVIVHHPYNALAWFEALENCGRNPNDQFAQGDVIIVGDNENLTGRMEDYHYPAKLTETEDAPVESILEFICRVTYSEE